MIEVRLLKGNDAAKKADPGTECIALAAAADAAADLECLRDGANDFLNTLRRKLKACGVK